MKFAKLFLTLTVFSVVLFYACGHKGSDPVPSAATACAAKSIGLTATITPSSSCSTNGQLVASASGSSGFTYQLNSGAFQSDPNFNNLSPGNYDLTVKDVDGCTKTTSFTVTSNSTKGPKYTAVASIITTKCRGGFCHSTGSGGAPIIMGTDCDIISRGSTIKVKAVDEGMGSLSSNDQNKIIAWINAGGRLTD